MSEKAPIRPTESEPAQDVEVTPVFPLLLLETMRDMDRPAEVLEDEDVSLSMPRRLGLSEVVGVQIRRLQDAVRKDLPQTAAVVEDLVRLVIRRPDAERIFEEAGRRVARHAWAKRAGAMRSTIRLMPLPLARVAAARAARRLFRRLAGTRRVRVNRWPTELRIRSPLSVRADPGGAACAFYAGVFAELLQQYTGRSYRVSHPQCAARSAQECRWTVEVQG